MRNIRNITVSGRVASGATTLSRLLAHKLGWKLINAGEMVREYMKKEGVPLENTLKTSDDFHKDLDLFIREKLKNEKQVIVESWLSGYDARDIDGVFKILVTCRDISLRIKRVTGRDNMTAAQAKKHIRERERQNLEKWKRIYNTGNIWSPKMYDLVIDTRGNNPDEALNDVMKAIGNKTQ